MEHTAFVYSSTPQQDNTAEQLRTARHQAVKCSRSTFCTMLAHVCSRRSAALASHARAIRCICLLRYVASLPNGVPGATHEQSIDLQNMAHSPPPSRPATCAVRHSVLLWSCYAAYTAHALIYAHERQALEHPSASTRSKHSNQRLSLCGIPVALFSNLSLHLFPKTTQTQVHPRSSSTSRSASTYSNGNSKLAGASMSSTFSDRYATNPVPARGACCFYCCEQRWA